MRTLLIGILHCGENEYDACRQALARQRFTDYDVFLIENQPNKIAHDAQYRRFAESSPDYRWFLKLDADMVFTGPDALDTLLGCGGDDIDVVMFDVHDCPSGLMIPALLMFSNRCRWPVKDDKLIVETTPAFDGKVYRERAHRIVDHNPSPTPLQAMRYGVHRALKAIQPDRPVERKELPRAMLHHTILKNVWRNRAAMPTNGWSMLGAEAVFNQLDPAVMHDYAGAPTRRVFERFRDSGPDAFLARYAPFWDHEILSNERWWGMFQRMRWN